MPDLYYFMIMALCVAWIWGFNYTFKPGEIFGDIGDWMRDTFQDRISKPLFDCPFCMSSVHGTAFFVVFLWGYPWYLWIIFCFSLTGLSALIKDD